MVILTSSTSFPGMSISSPKKSSSTNNETLLLDSTDRHETTHLHLEQKAISEIGEMGQFPRLLVLYLYDNKLSSMHNLEFCRNLTHLYLQNNRISRIQHLHPLKHLQKLFLSGNRISVLEGLEKNTELCELHLDYQKLKPGDHFITDKRTMATLQTCLLVLNISGTSLSSIQEIRGLLELTVLLAIKNDGIKCMDLLIEVLTTLPNLEKLDLSQCPVSKTTRYREHITLACRKIEELDGRAVTENNRQFMLGMRESFISQTNFHRPLKENKSSDPDILESFLSGTHLSRNENTISSVDKERRSSVLTGQTFFHKHSRKLYPRISAGAWVQAVRRIQSHHTKPPRLMRDQDQTLYHSEEF